MTLVGVLYGLTDNRREKHSAEVRRGLKEFVTPFQ